MSRGLIFLCAIFIAGYVEADGVPAPVESYFKSFSYQGMSLSPSGRYLAVLYPSNETSNIAVIDLDGKQSSGITNYGKSGRVLWFGWKSDDRVLFGLEGTRQGLSSYAVNSVARDGSDLYKIADDDGFGLISWLPNEPNYIIYNAYDQRHRIGANKIFVGGTHDKTVKWTEKTSVTEVALQPFGCRYMADNAGKVRLCTTSDPNGHSRVLYRDGDETSWRQIADASV